VLVKDPLVCTNEHLYYYTTAEIFSDIKWAKLTFDLLTYLSCHGHEAFCTLDGSAVTQIRVTE